MKAAATLNADELFAHLVFHADSELWDEYELPRLSLVQLRTLARLWGAPHSGTKEKVVVRILAVRAVRVRLAPFADDLEALASAFRKEALKHMAREAGLWRSGNKRQLAIALINWRARARQNGQQLLDRILELSRAQPRQLNLFKEAA